MKADTEYFIAEMAAKTIYVSDWSLARKHGLPIMPRSPYAAAIFDGPAACVLRHDGSVGHCSFNEAFGVDHGR
jgi:hypothetical protein